MNRLIVSITRKPAKFQAAFVGYFLSHATDDKSRVFVLVVTAIFCNGIGDPTLCVVLELNEVLVLVIALLQVTINGKLVQPAVWMLQFLHLELVVKLPVLATTSDALEVAANMDLLDSKRTITDILARSRVLSGKNRLNSTRRPCATAPNFSYIFHTSISI